jgi:benzylsuccinate CoA-transferase BbsF subunit
VGQHLDLSQFEGATHFLAPYIMKYIEDGTIPSRVGNTDSHAAPHGIFRCKDENREFVGKGESWIAISVKENSQWRALAALIGADGDERFGTEEDRRANSTQLEILIEAWTSKIGAQDAMVILQDIGISAGAVQSQADLWQDPQLRHMNYFQWLVHPELGSMPYDGLQFRMSDTPGRLRSPQAMIGEHNEEILRDCLGMTGLEIRRLSESGALENSIGMDL